jgi:hypothetical protein
VLQLHGTWNSLVVPIRPAGRAQPRGGQQPTTARPASSLCSPAGARPCRSPDTTGRGAVQWQRHDFPSLLLIHPAPGLPPLLAGHTPGLPASGRGPRLASICIDNRFSPRRTRTHTWCRLHRQGPGPGSRAGAAAQAIRHGAARPARGAAARAPPGGSY